MKWCYGVNRLFGGCSRGFYRCLNGALYRFFLIGCFLTWVWSSLSHSGIFAGGVSWFFPFSACSAFWASVVRLFRK